VVSARGASFVYPAGSRKGSPTEAVRGLDWDVLPGRITSVIGPSGCGKSTLLRGIAGLLPTSSGRLSVKLPKPPGIRDLAITFQSPALLPWLTLEANVLLPFKLAGARTGTTDLAALEHLLGTTGLGAFRTSYPHELSGGMAMRAAVVRAFLPRPGLVLMDEPFAALDEVTREKMCALLEGIWMESRNTVVFVTHNLTEAVLLSDRVSVLSPRPGRLLDEVEIEFPRPRPLSLVQSGEFRDKVASIRQLIRRGGDDES